MVAVGDTIRTTASTRDFPLKCEGVVHKLGVKHPGDVRVKFPHDKELIWVYSGEYERVSQ